MGAYHPEGNKLPYGMHLEKTDRWTGPMVEMMKDIETAAGISQCPLSVAPCIHTYSGRAVRNSVIKSVAPRFVKQMRT